MGQGGDGRPQLEDAQAAAKALGLKYEPWMDNLRSKDLHNGALVAMDYQTGDIVAYVGSADPNATKGTKKFQPQFDVLANGWRQPGSAFKPVVYSTGIANKSITAASMFMDVVTNFGGGYTPTDADNLERGPVRMRDALSFSLNIPAVKAGTVIGNDAIQAQAEAMGIQFQNGKVDATAAFPLGVEVVHPLDLVRAYGVLGDKGRLADQTTIISVTDNNGEPVDRRDRAHRSPRRSLDPGAAYITTDILAGNTNPRKNPFWGQFAIKDGGQAPAGDPQDRHQQRGARPQRLRLHRGARRERPQGRRVRARRRRLERQLGQLAGQPPASPLFSIDVTTYVWQGFMEEATKGWKINGFGGRRTTSTRGRRPVDGAARRARRPRSTSCSCRDRPTACCPPTRAAARRS